MALLLWTVGQATVADSPRPVLSWRFAGGSTLAGLTNVPPLHAALQLPETSRVGDRHATNLARVLLTRVRGKERLDDHTALWAPVVRALLAHPSQGELTREDWWVATPRRGLLEERRDALDQWMGPVTFDTASEWSLMASSPAALQRAAAAVASPSTHLLELEVALGWWLAPQPGNWPTIRWVHQVSGDTLRAEAEFYFDQDLNLDIDPWILPEQAIRPPLVQFTVARGIRDLWPLLPAIDSLLARPAPNQLAVWSQPLVPFRTWASLPVDRERAQQTLQAVEKRFTPYFDGSMGTNGAIMGRLARTTAGDALVLTDLQRVVQPVLGHPRSGDQTYLMMSFFSPLPGTNSFPADLRQQIDAPDLLLYDYEHLQESVQHWNAFLQFRRIMFGYRPAPAVKDSLNWLLAAIRDAGETVTEITHPSPRQLSLRRRGTLGLGGVELVALANWLDGPAQPTRFRVRFPSPPPLPAAPAAPPTQSGGPDTSPAPPGT